MSEHLSMHPDGRALFISVRPRFAELLLSGMKTVELRRAQPAVSSGAPVLLYASSPTCALLGTGTVEDVHVAAHDDIWHHHGPRTGISRDEYDDYFEGASAAVAITLADVCRLERPVPLRELRRGRAWFRPPQSFRYLNAQQTASLGVAVPWPAAAA
jgi:predicted transcriptional regulator